VAVEAFLEEVGLLVAMAAMAAATAAAG